MLERKRKTEMGMRKHTVHAERTPENKDRERKKERKGIEEQKKTIKRKGQ